jgi:hypothetical protein
MKASKFRSGLVLTNLLLVGKLAMQSSGGLQAIKDYCS